MELFTDFTLNVDESTLIKSQGKNTRKLLEKKSVLGKFQQIQTLIPQIIKPKLGWQRFVIQSFNTQSNEFQLSDGNIIHGGPVVGLILGKRSLTTEIILGICTLGLDIDTQITAFTENRDILSSVLLDGIGSFLVSSVLNQFFNRITFQLSKEHLFPCFPFLPGDTDWPIQDQTVLFSLLDAPRLGLILRESLLMVPTKSLSFMIGISTQSYHLDGKTRCDYCGRRSTCFAYKNITE
jgi:hypothetical protein